MNTWETVMCLHCLREVAAIKKCPVCGASLTDERGLYMAPLEALGFVDPYLDDREGDDGLGDREDRGGSQGVSRVENRR